jgi:hypothetical protein
MKKGGSPGICVMKMERSAGVEPLFLKAAYVEI